MWGFWPIPSLAEFALLKREWGYQEVMPCDHLERRHFSIESVVYRSVLPSLLFGPIQMEGEILFPTNPTKMRTQILCD